MAKRVGIVSIQLIASAICALILLMVMIQFLPSRHIIMDPKKSALDLGIILKHVPSSNITERGLILLKEVGGRLLTDPAYGWYLSLLGVLFPAAAANRRIPHEQYTCHVAAAVVLAICNFFIVWWVVVQEDGYLVPGGEYLVVELALYITSLGPPILLVRTMLPPGWAMATVETIIQASRQAVETLRQVSRESFRAIVGAFRRSESAPVYVNLA